jgi:UDP-2,3-diacylglucosamine pyrophosphatase LpxH
METAAAEYTYLIVSDLHLSSEEELDDFKADEEFGDFLRYYAALGRPVRLVLNGDFLDFLQADGRRLTEDQHRLEHKLESIHPITYTEGQAVVALEKTIERHPRFFAALREFVLAGPQNRLSILKGNHDIELAFEGVKKRIVKELGDEAGARTDFPPYGLWDEGQGLYVEHGNQFDRWNSFHNFAEPFVDRDKRILETPFGSIFVKTFWNRVEGEFPFVDKVRPMGDTIAVVASRRPTFWFLKFDFFYDLAASVLKRDLSTFFVRHYRPRRTGTESAPEKVSVQETMLSHFGRLTTLTVFFMLVYLLLRGLFVFDVEKKMSLVKSLSYAGNEGLRFLMFVGGSVAVYLVAKAVRYYLLKANFYLYTTIFIYRMLVFASAGLFLFGVVRFFWIPVVIAVVIYFFFDADRTIRFSIDEPRARPGDENADEVRVAAKMLKVAGVRTVVFGHTHVARMEHVSHGGVFVNSGTWVQNIDLRSAAEQVVSNTFVLFEGGAARLMTWRGLSGAKELSETAE